MHLNPKEKCCVILLEEILEELLLERASNSRHFFITEKHGPVTDSKYFGGFWPKSGIGTKAGLVTGHQAYL